MLSAYNRLRWKVRVIAGMARDAGRRYYRILLISRPAKWWHCCGSGRQKSAAAMSARSAAGKFTLSGEITLYAPGWTDMPITSGSLGQYAKLRVAGGTGA